MPLQAARIPLTPQRRAETLLRHVVFRKEEYGHERDSDLVPLCQQDHQKYHDRYGTQGNMTRTTIALIDERRQDIEMRELVSRPG